MRRHRSICREASSSIICASATVGINVPSMSPVQTVKFGSSGLKYTEKPTKRAGFAGAASFGLLFSSLMAYIVGQVFDVATPAKLTAVAVKVPDVTIS